MPRATAIFDATSNSPKGLPTASAEKDSGSREYIAVAVKKLVLEKIDEAKMK